MKSKKKATPSRIIWNKWWFWTIVIVAVIGIIGSIGQSEPTAPSTAEKTTTASEQITNPAIEANEYSVVEKFIALYTASGDNPISDVTTMDIQGADYRTEFRLNAFKNAVGQKGNISTGSIEVINYGVWENDSIRIYARVNAHEAAVEMVYNTIHILDSSVTDEQITDELAVEQTILLGDKNQIDGYISADYADGGIVGYDVMIDCSNVNFME